MGGPPDSHAHGETHAQLHYIDDFLGLDCASRLLDLKLFPNSKEITESMACWR